MIGSFVVRVLTLNGSCQATPGKGFLEVVSLGVREIGNGRGRDIGFDTKSMIEMRRRPLILEVE